MTRKTERPDLPGCPKAPLRLFGRAGVHEWNYSSSWNGNWKEVLPFIDHPYGIARSGWRCFHCGKFRWDQTDVQYALGVAWGLGLVKLPTAPVCEEV